MLIASGQKKTLIPVFKGIDAYDMPKEFRKLAAQDMGKVGAMQDLVRGVEKLLGKGGAAETPKEQPVIVQSGGPNVTALLDRGFLSLEDSDWSKAQELFDQVLNIDPRNADAYLGLAMSELKCGDRTLLQNNYITQGTIYRNNKHLARAKQFGDEALGIWLEQIDADALAYEKAAAEKAVAEKAAIEREVAKREAAEKAVIERKKKIEALQKEESDLRTEIYNTWGLFTTSRIKSLKKRLDEVKAELKKLQ